MNDKYIKALGSEIEVNNINVGSIGGGGTIDVNLENSLGSPVAPTLVGLVGNTLTIEVPSGDEYRHEWDEPYSYCGLAPNGTSESSPTWTITRLEVFENGTTDVKTSTGEWDNRTTLTYT
jgi:hypothetical protein